jgi:hypothetical protein
MTTKRGKPKKQKPAAPKTDCTRRKSERDKKCAPPESATQPAAKTATGETGKMDKLFMAPNVQAQRLPKAVRWSAVLADMLSATMVTIFKIGSSLISLAICIVSSMISSRLLIAHA